MSGNQCGLGMLIGLALMSTVSCGSGQQATLASAETSSPAKPAPSLAMAEARIAALQTPAGTDGSALAALQAELIRQLQDNSLDGRTVRSAFREQDLVELSYYDGALRWSFALSGDYDRNGEVNAADLVPLAGSLGSQVTGSPNSLQALLDGDGNGFINLADISAIAQNYGTQLSGWVAYKSSNLAEYPLSGPGNYSNSSYVGKRLLLEGSGPGRRQYAIACDAGPGDYFWLMSGNGEDFVASSHIFSPGEPPVESSLSWGREQGSFGNTGQSAYVLPTSPGRLWEQLGVVSEDQGVVLDAKRRALVAGGKLRAFNPDGSLSWESDLSDEGRTPAIGPDGRIFVSCRDGQLQAFSPEGSPLWSFDSEHEDPGPAASGPDGSVYFVDGHQVLQALSAEGEHRWSSYQIQLRKRRPLIDRQGTIYIANTNWFLYALDSQGQELWDFNSGNRTLFDPVLYDDDTVLLSSAEYLFAVRGGEELWQYQLPSTMLSMPAVSDNGNIIFAAQSEYANNPKPSGLLALDGTGEQLWSETPYLYPDGAGYQPLIDANGISYLPGEDRRTIAVDKHGLLVGTRPGLPLYRESYYVTPAVLSADGIVYMAYDGRLQAYGSTPAVANLSASQGKYYNRIRLTWDAVQGADAYQLEARFWTEDGTEKWYGGYGDIAADRTQYDLGVGGDDPREIRLRAVQHGQSAAMWSQPAYGFASLLRVTELSASDNDPEGITVSWQEIPYSRGYILEYRNADGGSPADWTQLANPRYDYMHSFNHTMAYPAGMGCEAGVHYEYRAKPVYYNGEFEDWSETDSGIRADSWTSPGHDGQGTGRTTLMGPQTAVEFERYTLEYRAEGDLLAYSDNVIIGRTNRDSLFSLGPDGTVSWSIPGTYSKRYRHAPVIDRRGRILAISDDALHYYDQAGSLLKELALPGAYFGPLLSSEELLRVGCQDVLACSFEPNADLLWSVKLPKSEPYSASIGRDGTLYVVCDEYYLASISPSGELNWISFVNRCLDRPAIGLDGQIYLGTYVGIMAINPDGNTAWIYATGDEVVCRPVIGWDGTVYAGSMDGIFHAVNPDGSMRWQDEAYGAVRRSAAVDGAGHIYYGDDAGVVSGLDENGNELWRYGTGYPISTSPVISPDGTLYIGNVDDKIHAFHDGGS